MSDEPQQQELGGNAAADLKRRVDRRLEIYEEAEGLRKQLAEFKAEDKSDGFTEAAIADAVKLRRADPEKVLKALTLDAEKRVYRKAAGVETDLKAAAEAARRHAESLPEPKRQSRRRGMN
jgi:uncharacterized protein (UPF0335 family)